MLMMTEPGGQVGQRWEEEELVNIDSPVGWSDDDDNDDDDDDDDY